MICPTSRPSNAVFQGQRGLAGRQTVPGERRPIEVNAHRWDVGLRLQRQVDETGDVLHRRDDLVPERPQHTQVVPEDLDGDVGGVTPIACGRSGARSAGRW